MRTVALLDHRYVAPQAPVMLADAQQQDRIPQEADIDVNADILTQKPVLGHAQVRADLRGDSTARMALRPGTSMR